MPNTPPLHTFQVSKSEHQTEIGRFLAESLGISMRKAKSLLDAKAVWVNQKRVWMAKHRVSRGDLVEVRTAISSQSSKKPPLDVLYEDSSLLALAKPPGTVSESHTGGSTHGHLLAIQQKAPP